MRFKIIGFAAAALAALGLSACGGGGGGGSASAPPPAGTTPPSAAPIPVTASGVITGFSSVFVNGARYEVASDTVVAVEGETERLGDDSALRIGMKVRVRANETDGQRVAERIDYDDDLKGPATDVMVNPGNPGLGSFSVMRQSVVVDANTAFDDDVGDNNADGAIDIRDLILPAGQIVVEVSGLVIADGFLATRIDRVNGFAGAPDVDDDEFEVKGFVDEVASDGSSFRINNATFVVIDGAGGTFFADGLVADQTLVGVFVEVEADLDASGAFVAVEVEREDDFDDNNGDGRIDDDDRNGKFEIEGILVSVDTDVVPNQVVIGSVTLAVSDASALSGQEGRLLEIEGRFDDNGVLVLSQSRPEVENSIRIEDRVSQVDTTSLTTRLGIVITPTGMSRIEDDVAEGGDRLTPDEFLQRILPNDYVEARGYLDAQDAVVWSRIEREDEDDQACKLRGAVTSIEGDDANDFSFVIQGVTVDVSQINSADDFEGVNDQPLGRLTFFEMLSVGDIVEAESDDNGLGCVAGRLTAEEVAFEADDGLVGTVPDQVMGSAQLTGTPMNVSNNSFELNGEVITVVGSTLIDDSIIERAQGRENNGDDVPFDQIPAGLTLADLLPGSFTISVTVNSDGVALEIEDL
ncbi:MAG: DUF5666 domain-containing protein [bacterium]